MSECQVPSDYTSPTDSSGGAGIQKKDLSLGDPFKIPYSLAYQGQNCNNYEGRESRDPCASVRNPREYDL
jgi:hypothetical protein